jgi:hypothetical protein
VNPVGGAEVGQILKWIGEFLAPLWKVTFPILLDYLRQPVDGIRIKTTPEQQAETKEVNDEWDQILSDYDLPPEYRDAYGVLP